MKTEDFVTKNIMAIVPKYMPDEGDRTIIYTKEENIVLSLRVRNIVRKLCKHYQLDMKASNEYFGGLISVSNMIPLPLARDKVFIQLKVRKPISRYDGGVGLFNIDSIERVKEGEDGIYIVLKNGIEIKTLYVRSSIEKHIRQGQMVKNLYDTRIYTLNEAMERYETSDTPATKSDIARLYMAIKEMSNKLD